MRRAARIWRALSRSRRAARFGYFSADPASPGARGIVVSRGLTRRRPAVLLRGRAEGEEGRRGPGRGEGARRLALRGMRRTGTPPLMMGTVQAGGQAQRSRGPPARWGLTGGLV